MHRETRVDSLSCRLNRGAESLLLHRVRQGLLNVWLAFGVPSTPHCFQRVPHRMCKLLRVIQVLGSRLSVFAAKFGRSWYLYLPEQECVSKPWGFDPRREEKENTGPTCKEQITRIELDAANDFQLDRTLFAACKTDADQSCAGVENKDGAIQECLVRKGPVYRRV